MLISETLKAPLDGFQRLSDIFKSVIVESVTLRAIKNVMQKIRKKLTTGFF